MSGNQTHSASLGNRVGLHYSRFRLFGRANSVNNQWFTDSIQVQNRHFRTRIREDGLALGLVNYFQPYEEVHRRNVERVLAAG